MIPAGATQALNDKKISPEHLLYEWDTGKNVRDRSRPCLPHRIPTGGGPPKRRQCDHSGGACFCLRQGTLSRMEFRVGVRNLLGEGVDVRAVDAFFEEFDDEYKPNNASLTLFNFHLHLIYQ